MKTRILLLLGFYLAPLWAFAQKKKPNIVFFLVDDLGYKDLGVYGAKLYETPNIDKLSRAGVRFTNAYTAAPICSPTRAAVLTGKHPLRMKMWHAPHFIPKEDSKQMLPKLLSDQGYSSWHVGKWHLGTPKDHTLPQDVGFHINIGGGISWGPGSYFWPYKTNPDGSPMGHQRDHAPLRQGGFEGEQLTDRLTREAVNLIENHKGDNPVYLNLWYYSVHNRKEAKPELVEKYKKKIKRMGTKKSVRVHMGDTLLASETNPLYAAMLETVDNSVGAVVKALKKKGMYENTLFIFYSDNGPTTNDVPCAPFLGGKNTTYEAGVRMPAFMTWPKEVPKNRVSDERIIIMDVFNTVLAATDTPIPEKVENDGISLMPHLKDNASVPRRDFYWYFPDTRRMYGGRASAAVLGKDGHKYIHFYKGYAPELYDIDADKAERHDLISQKPAKAKALQKKLNDFLLGYGYDRMDKQIRKAGKNRQ
ncbi:sulfatase [Fulvitalea axinellae]|uniref:Sulfatase n=1 Tax=Fulvitalea axinellae TaxID=1182444 RepID=A0AAU9DD83_9BACT|nr:sulfatase [Fulvitalea axinellae]